MEDICMIPLRSKRILVVFTPIVYVFLVVFLVFSVVQAYNTRESTGVLIVNTSDKTSAITISATNTQAALLGTGSAKARLKPGSYFVMAQAKGLQATQTVTVSLHKTTAIKLQLANAKPLIASPDSVTFINTSSLLNYGISSSQVTNLKQLLFTYAPSAKIISIDATSIQPGIHDPNSTSPWFSLTFSGDIDGSKYNATLEYSGYDTTKLTLTNPTTGAQLFTGQLPPVPTTD